MKCAVVIFLREKGATMLWSGGMTATWGRSGLGTR